ncbi:MAG TPA: GntG family PLP-dependent aldolase, partial [Chloroflexota bacterium]
PDRIRSAIRDPGDPHFPPTGCVALENTHNRCGGSVITPEEIAAVAAVAHEQGIPVHLDGARVFNAAVALSAPVSEVVRSVDSVTFCLSKGLGAPVGSLLCGSKAYIERAYRWRKLLGGAMRQVGILAAAGLVALEEGVDRLGEDHENARALAEGLAAIPGIDIDPRSVQTNIVVFDVAAIGTSPQAFVAGLMDRGVKLADVGGSRMRAVTSYEVNRNDIDVALQEIAELAVRATPALA